MRAPQGHPRFGILAATVLLCFLVVCKANARQIPIGIQNSNPGNVIPQKWYKWHGAVGVDAYGHAIFKTDLHGFRAIKKVLRSYDKRGIDTSYKIVRRYINLSATDSQRLEYCRTIKMFTGKGPHEFLDLKDRHTTLRIAKGIVRHENGYDPYSDSLYRRVFLNEP